MMLVGSVSISRLSLLGGCCLLGASHVAAQFQEHHQQYINTFELYKTSDTKALTPVQTKFTKKLKWSFASTVMREFTPPNINGVYVPDQIATLLVKLGNNLIDPNSFPFEWAWEYYAWKEENSDATIDIDVEDVYYENKKDGYILCGKATIDPADPDLSTTSAFLMRVSADGSTVTHTRMYPAVSNSGTDNFGVYAFKSVVPWRDGKGYIAVGETTKPTTGDLKGKSAAYVSVDKGLNLMCSRRFDGSFHLPNLDVSPDDPPIESTFNKVIPYKWKDGNKKFKGYAVVGDTVLRTPFSQLKCPESDIIVVSADEKCTVDRKLQHGHNPIDPDLGSIYESGLSIAQIREPKPDLVITGNVKKYVDCDSTATGQVVAVPDYDDILVMRLKKNLKLKWWRRYDVQGHPDRGTAVQVKKKQILVAGETNTKELSGASGGTTKDAFLLDVKVNNGNVNKLDLFGLIYGTDNGALSPGNLDLHLTNVDNQGTSSDKHAVLMGNTFVDPDHSRKYPYLVERYETISVSSVNQCVWAKRTPKIFKSKFKPQKIRDKQFKPKEKKFYVEPVKTEFRNEIKCPKKP